MAITALHSAASGLRALSTQIDVVANNLANAETTAFKRSRVNFEDLMYLQLKQPGTTNGVGDISPAGIMVGLGTRVSNTQLDLEQGSLESTNRQLDVGVQGQGFFKVKTLDAVGNGQAYTRNGNFFVNANGELVLGLGDGYKLIPPITIPNGTTEISIAIDGTISVLRAGATAKQTVGALSLTQFVNPQGLRLVGGSLYTETEASGTPVDGKPGENGAGTILQGFLEASNVDPVKELVTLIKTQRAFELNSQSIQTADQALQTIGNLRRGQPPLNVGDMEVAMMNNNGRPLSVKKKIQFLVALTILAWATQTLFHQWGFGQTTTQASTDSTDIAPERFIVPVTRGGPGATLELRGEATVVGAEVTLKQICRWSGADTAKFAPVADLVVMRLAQGKPFRSIEIDELKQTLHDAGVGLANIKFAGAMSCTVNRSDVEVDERTALQQWIDARQGRNTETVSVPATQPARPAAAGVATLEANAEPAVARIVSTIAPQAPTTAPAPLENGVQPGRTLRQILTADVSDHLGVPIEALQMRFAQKDDKVLNLAEPIFTFEVTAQRLRNLGDVAWDVVVVTESGTQKVSIAANARAWQSQVIVAKPMSVKQTIQDEDVSDRRTLVDRLPDEMLLTRQQIVGQQAARDLRAGTVMTARLVEPVPLVQPGQFVTISLGNSAVQIKTVAKALERGSFGQTVRVRNETTKDVYEVVMTGPQTARLGAAETVATVDKN